MEPSFGLGHGAALHAPAIFDVAQGGEDGSAGDAQDDGQLGQWKLGPLLLK